jgi:hypothetical protein
MNSSRHVLESLAERYAERHPETKGPKPDKPVLDQPVPVPMLESPDPPHRAVEARLWELEAAWAAWQSAHWQ